MVTYQISKACQKSIHLYYTTDSDVVDPSDFAPFTSTVLLLLVDMLAVSLVEFSR